MGKIFKRLSINTLVIISFFCFAVFNVLLIWHNNIYTDGDFYFHASRFLELVRGGFAPQFAFHTISDNGSAVMSMYPYLFLYPFALILKIIGVSHVTFMFRFMAIINSFATLLISYYSSLKLGSKRISYIFALVYTLSFEYLSIIFRQGDFGMSWAATFMPLALFGFLYWIKSNKWLMLSIGMTCIVYSNISVAFFTPILLLFWVIYDHKDITYHHIKNLTKAILLTSISSAWFWMPAIKLSLSNKFSGVGNLNGSISSTDITESLEATLNPTSSFLFEYGFALELTIYALIGLIMGFVYYKNFNKYIRQSFIFSIFVIVISTGFIPWQSDLLGHIAGLIQTTMRFYLIPQVLLAYIFSYSLNKYFLKKHTNPAKYTKIFLLIILGIIFIQICYGSDFYHQQNVYRHGIFSYKSFTNVIGNKGIDHDYYLGNVDQTIIKDQGIINNNLNQTLPFKASKNGILTFNNNTNNTINKLSLPVLYYHGQPYRCYLDHKLIKSYPNQNRLMTINNVSTGNHHIHVITPLTKTDIFARLLTIMSIFIYLDIIHKYRKQQKTN